MIQGQLKKFLKEAKPFSLTNIWNNSSSSQNVFQNSTGITMPRKKAKKKFRKSRRISSWMVLVKKKTSKS